MKIYKKTLLLISVLSIFSSNVIKTVALTISPDVVCYEDLGCYIRTSTSKKITTQLYKQTYQYPKSSHWGLDSMSGGCGTIGAVGCAITSFAMLLTTYGDYNGVDYSTIYNPGAVNQTLINNGKSTCSFDASTFTTPFSSVISYVGTYTIPTQYRQNKPHIYNEIAKAIFAGNLVILKGQYSEVVNGVTNTYTHYAVAYGYDGTTDEYQYGILISNITKIYINDPGAVRLDLSQFMSKYNTVTNLYYYKKKV